MRMQPCPSKQDKLRRRGQQDVRSRVETQHLDEALDEALMESFPASDPVAISFCGPVHITGTASREDDDLQQSANQGPKPLG